MISGTANIKNAVEAIKFGAKDFIEKPLHLEEIIKVVNEIKNRFAVKHERNQLLSDILSKYEILGNSQKIDDIKKQITLYAKINEPILIYGESGTGKELVAANLHYLSDRKANKYFKINISSIPENLIESELFGYKKGAFSGANEDKKGIFELSDNSTLFLDEIGELKYDIQPKLLRVIQEKEIFPIAGTSTIKLNTKMVFATNKNLVKEIDKNKFREDLFYRLSALKIELPPLRERLEDLEILSNKIINDFTTENNIRNKELSKNAVEKLYSYRYPGNVRELKNIVSTAIMKTEYETRDVILDRDIDFQNDIVINPKKDMANIFETPDSLANKKKELEKLFVETQLKINNYDINKTSEVLQIIPNNLYRKIKELGIDI